MAKKITINKKIIIKKLSEVIDPEINLSIVDLGFIYQIKIKKEKSLPKIFIKMTLTTPGCPMFSYFENEVTNKIKELGINEKNIKIEFTFDPPWSIGRINKKAKKILGV